MERLYIETRRNRSVELFDRLPATDRRNYIDLLMRGAESVDRSRKDDATKLDQLFNHIGPAVSWRLGAAAPRLEGGDALAVTLERSAMEMPDTSHGGKVGGVPARTPYSSVRERLLSVSPRSLRIIARPVEPAGPAAL